LDGLLVFGIVIYFALLSHRTLLNSNIQFYSFCKLKKKSSHLLVQRLLRSNKHTDTVKQHSTSSDRELSSLTCDLTNSAGRS